jgi:hypothetical protein
VPLNFYLNLFVVQKVLSYGRTFHSASTCRLAPLSAAATSGASAYSYGLASSTGA